MADDMTAEEWLERGIELGQLGRHGDALGAYDKASEINQQYTP